MVFHFSVANTYTLLIQQTDILGAFEYMGEGWCLDSLGREHDWLDFYVVNGAYAPEDCGLKCKKTANFRGFTISDIQWCSCYYDEGKAPPAYDGALFDVGTGGTGPITQIDHTGKDCYCYRFVPNSAIFLPAAKFVKISLPGQGSINILEVQVFDNSNMNRALGSLGAIASQSTTYLWSNITSCNASFAIDGNTDRKLTIPCHGLAHTAATQDPWWQVEMLGTFKISSIVIYNRMSCCSDRLSHASVSLLDANGNTVGQILDIGDTSYKRIITLSAHDFAMTFEPTKVS
jgi:hypothetical protein